MISPALRVMAESPLIRPFRPDDAEACSNIVRACLQLETLMAPAVIAELLRTESPEIMRERARLFYVAVCMLGNDVTAVGGVDMNEIRLLYVDPANQRKGVGSSVLRHLEALVPPALFGDIFVYSTPTAVPFYRAHGYEARGEHGFIAAGYTVRTVFMTKRRSNDESQRTGS